MQEENTPFPLFAIASNNEVIKNIEENNTEETVSEEVIRKRVALSSICSFVESKKEISANARRPIEDRWLKNYRLYRGQLSPEEVSGLARARERNPTASEIFFKLTKTKALAAYGQICEVLFSEDRFPIAVQATPIPEGIEEDVFIAPEELGSMYGYPGDGKDLEPGASKKSLLGGWLDKYKELLKGKTVLAGKSPDPRAMKQLSPAEMSAEKLDKTIQDQLLESKASVELAHLVFENVIYGTGVFKGPMVGKKTINKWEKDPETGINTYNPTEKLIPKIRWVSVWNYYPEPDVKTPSWEIEKHLMSPHAVRMLKQQPGFDKDAITMLLNNPARRQVEHWENLLTEANSSLQANEYEVLEYWGYLDKDLLSYFPSIEQEKLKKYVDIAEVSIWTSQGYILKIILNPFIPERSPYYVVPYEEHPGQLWGIGLPENMEDPQRICNAHLRMAEDNLKFSGSIMFEVNESQLSPGQDNKIYPGKVWRKQGGAPGQSIFGFTTPNTAPAHIQMLDKARQLADEASGQFSNSYGSTGSPNQPRSAAGMAMLMSASSSNIKNVIKNFDNYLLEPLGQALFNWNMQFNDDAEVHGDIQIVSRGTSSLMQREVHSQRLLSFLQITGNPNVAPMINMEYLLKEIAKSLDLDKDKLVNSVADASLYAEMIGKANGNGNQQQPSQEAGGAQPPGGSGGDRGATAGLNPEDATGTGGGNIGVGSSPSPGQAGFSG